MSKDSKSVAMFIILSAGMSTAVAATTMSLADPAFADKKHCVKNNDGKNKNKYRTQGNDILNGLICVNEAAKVIDLTIVNSPAFGP